MACRPNNYDSYGYEESRFNQDKIKHETELCEYREIAAHDFKEIREMFQLSFVHVDKVKMQMNEINGKMDQKFIDVCNEGIDSSLKIIQSTAYEKQSTCAYCTYVLKFCLCLLWICFIALFSFIFCFSFALHKYVKI